MTEARSPVIKVKALEILDAAIEIFQQQGYAALSIKRVADRAGVSNGHLQHYFSNKDALIEAMFEKLLYDYKARWLKQTFEAEIPDPVEKFKHAVAFHLEMAANSRANQIAWEIWAQSGRQERVRRIMTQWLDWIIHDYAELIALINPALSKPQALQRAVMVNSMLDGSTLGIGQCYLEQLPIKRTGLAGFKHQVTEQLLNLIKAPL